MVNGENGPLVRAREGERVQAFAVEDRRAPAGLIVAGEPGAGNYAAMRRLLTEADVAAVWYDWPPHLPARAETRCHQLIADGNLDAARALADESMPGTRGQPAASQFLGDVIRGRISVWRAEPGDVVRWFERAAAGADECGFADPGVRRYLDSWLAEAYLGEGKSAKACRISARLHEIGERLHRPALIGQAFRIDAKAAALQGDLDAAAPFARQAVTAHESTALRPELARSLLTLGQIDRRRKARQLSRTALNRAFDLATEMDHRPLMALLERELPRSASTRAGSELTATERRVAELVAQGATNRDAAAALFIGVRTVETHVAAIYRKLGVRNRAEMRARYRPADTA